MKILIDVKQDLKPTKNDVMIYTESGWQCLPKVVVFEQELSKIRELEAIISEQNKKIEKMQTNISFMAKALKENVK